jgi:hypothetical protein
LRERADEQLARILWGQYALFLSIRIQDDLLDRQRDDLRLVFVANRFLLESLETFQSLTSLDSGFWDFYRECLRRTVEAILSVRHLESAPGRFRTEHLTLHAEVGSIFKVGVVAVCTLHGRRGEAEWMLDLLDHLAVISQIRDDLEDLEPDLKAGRFTWAANMLLDAARGDGVSSVKSRRLLGQSPLRSDRDELLLAELRRHAGLAAAAVPSRAPRAVHEMVGRLGCENDTLERGMHEARVRFVFGDALDSGAAGREGRTGKRRTVLSDAARNT